MAVINLAGSAQALSTSLNTIFSEFRMLRQETGVCRKCASQTKLEPHTGTAKNILNYGRLTAYGLTDGVDMVQAQGLSDTNTAFTPAEAGVQVILPWTTLRRIADPDLLRRTGQMMTLAYDRKEDTDATLQFVNWTPILPTSGATGTVMGIGHVMAAEGILRSGSGTTAIGATTIAEPAPEPFYLISHPNSLIQVASKLVPTSASQVGDTSISAGVLGGQLGPGGRRGAYSDEIVKEGPDSIGKLFGFEVYSDANIGLVASATAYSAAFSKESLVYCSEIEPHMEPDEKDVSQRAVELNLWGSFVWGLYRATLFGVALYMDITVPTS